MTFSRLDKFITINVVPSIRRILSLNDKPAIPVLMYHSVSEPDVRFSHPYFQTGISSRVFEEQMKFLDENEYYSIDLSELPDAIEKNTGGRRPVVITFDDGYKDFMFNALPIMEKYLFNATVFLPTGMMGSKSSMFGGKELLDWSDVRELRKQKVTFGSHSVNHRILKILPFKEMEAELRGSKNEIESRLGETVDAFSYPYAFPEGNEDYLGEYFGILDRCGYRFAVTTVIGKVGKGDNPLALKRLPVNEYDDTTLFKAKLEGAYDWMHVPQYLRKKYFGWMGQ